MLVMFPSSSFQLNFLSTSTHNLKNSHFQICPLSPPSKTQNFTHHRIYYWKASKTRQLKCSPSKNTLFRYVPIFLLKKYTFLFCRLVFDKDYGDWEKKNPNSTHNKEQPHRNKSTHEYIRCESWNLKCPWMFVYITRGMDIYYFLSTFPSNRACGCIFKWPLLLTSNLVQAGLYLSSGIRAKYNRGYLKRASCCYVEM